MRDRGGAAVKSRGRIRAPDVSTMGLALDEASVVRAQAVAETLARQATDFVRRQVDLGGMFGRGRRG